MYLVLVCLVLVSLCKSECDVPSLTTASGSIVVPGAVFCSGELIFDDNFDEFDLKIWDHEINLAGGNNNEFEWYNNNRSNSYVENGVLHIKPTLVADEKGEDFLYNGTVQILSVFPNSVCNNPTANGCSKVGSSDSIINPIKSARIRTIHSFSFKYGKVEIRARIPAGDWLWPALWMKPTYNTYSDWPASGEIDIMESRGNLELLDSLNRNIGTQLIGGTLHHGPFSSLNLYRNTHFEYRNSKGFDKEFHDYQIHWTPETITFSVDNQTYGKVVPPEGGFYEMDGLNGTGLYNPWRGRPKMAPFDQEFHILINLAVGGGFFSDAVTNPGGKPWKRDSPRGATDFWEGRAQWLPTWKLETDQAAFKIDHVKIWAL